MLDFWNYFQKNILEGNPPWNNFIKVGGINQPCNTGQPSVEHVCRSQQSSPISIIQYNQQCLEKTSVDAHGLSSCLGCSRILWHLISFQDHHRDSNMPDHVKSCHMMSHHLTSCHIMSHHVTSCHLTPHHFATQPQIVEQACNDCAKPSMKCKEVPKCSLNRSNCHCCGHLQVTQVKYWLGRRSCREVNLKSSWKANENSVNHEFEVYQSIPRVLKTGGCVRIKR